MSFIKGPEKVEIFNMLTQENRANILISAGAPPGKADVGSKKITEFWSYFQHQMLEAQLYQLFKDYPTAQQIIGSYGIGVPAIPQYTEVARQSGPSAPSQQRNLISEAYDGILADQQITCKTFFTDLEGVHAVSAHELIGALDKTGLWEEILAEHGILEANVQLASEMVRRKEAWKSKKISPTKLMIKDLLASRNWADGSMIKFAQNLIEMGNRKSGSAEDWKNKITPILEEWLEQIDEKRLNAKKSGAKRFETAKDLNQFLIDLKDDDGDEVFKASTVVQIVANLQNDDIKNIKMLKKLSDDQMKHYGMKMGQILVVREALEMQMEKK